MNHSTKTARDVWEKAVSYQKTRDIDGWVNSFAADGIMEWPFRLNGVPARAEGREAIRAAVGPVWARAKETNRLITGHEHVVFHQTTDPEVSLVEFDMVGEAASGPFRQPVLYLLHIRDGHILLLRDYVDTARVNELFRS